MKNKDDEYKKSETWEERFKRYEAEFASRNFSRRYKFTTSVIANDFTEVITLLNKYSPDSIYNVKYFGTSYENNIDNYTDKKLDGGIRASHTSGETQTDGHYTVNIALYLDTSGLSHYQGRNPFRFVDFVDEPHTWSWEAYGKSKVMSIGEHKLFRDGDCVGMQKYIRQAGSNILFIREPQELMILDPIFRNSKTGFELYRMTKKTEAFCIVVERKDRLSFSHTLYDMRRSTLQDTASGLIKPIKYIEATNGGATRLEHKAYYPWTSFYGVMLKGKDNEYWDYIAKQLAKKMGLLPGNSGNYGAHYHAYHDSLYPIALAATLKIQELFLSKITP